MARVGIGFPAGRKRRIEQGQATVPFLVPSQQWDGSAGSGFDTVPSQPARLTAKPALRLIVPPNQHFTDTLLVGFVAWANDGGSMLHSNGLRYVRVSFEGNSVEVKGPSLRSFEDANGNIVAYRAFWAMLERPSGQTGIAQVYAEAVPRDPSMQSRVIGPFSYSLVDTLHDFTATVDPDNPGGSVYSDIVWALAAAKAAGAQNPLITVTKTGTYRLVRPDDSAAVSPAYAGSGYATIDAAPGITATIGYTGGDTGIMRSRYDRLHLKGAGIVLDMETISSLYNDGTGNHWLDGCCLLHTNGNQTLWLGTTRVEAYAVRGSPWFTEASFEGINSPGANSSLMRGCTANNCYNDFAAQPSCLLGNNITNHSAQFFASYIDAMSLSYTGSAATATLEAWDNSSERTFLFKEDGVNVASIATKLSTWWPVNDPSAPYWVSDLVDAIAAEPALADWSAALLDDTRQAGHLGTSSSKGLPFGAQTITATPTTFKTFVDLHTDFTQFGNSGGAENVIIEGNQALDLDGQIIWVSSDGDIKDVFYVNNVFNAPNGIGALSQISRTGAKSHLVLAHNTLTQQTLLIRNRNLGDYSLIANNVMPNISVEGSISIGTADVKNNHVFAGGSALAGAVGTVIAGSETTLFADAISHDFSPAGELLSNLKLPVVRFDRTGGFRAPMESVGATSTVAAQPIVRLSGLSLSQTKIPEGALAGSLVSTINGITIGSSIELIDSAGGRFALSGGDLVLGSTPLDFESSQSHEITLRETFQSASNSPRDSHLTITVVNVLEVVLEELSLTANTVSENAAQGTEVGTIVSATEGAALSLLDDAGGRFALVGSKIFTGSTPLDFESAASHSITLRESHVDAMNSPRDTTLSVTVSDVYEAPTPESELKAALSGSPQSAFADFRLATNTGNWIASDLSNNGNDFTQASGTFKPGIDPALGAIFSAASANHFISYPVSGGTFSVILALTKDETDERGTPISNGSSNPGRYQNSGAIGIAGSCFVDGVQVTNADAFHDLLDDGQEHLIEWYNISAAGWTNIGIGRGSDSIGGSVRCAAIIDEQTVSDLTLARDKARDWVQS